MVKDILVNGNGGWLGAVARLGLSVVLAAGLTAFLALRVDANIDVMLTNQSAILTNQATAEVNWQAFTTEQRRESRQSLALLLQTCLNTARTDAQQQACTAAAR